MRAATIMGAVLVLGIGCGRVEETGPADGIGADLDTMTLAADVEALEAASQRALVAFREDDAATLDALYADIAVLVNPGLEPIEGRAAIDSIHREEMARAGYVVDWESIQVDAAESGDLGYVFGQWSVRSEDGSLPDDHGYFVNVFRKVDGVWRTVLEVNGSSAPRP